jgi:hypothetical protein
MLATLARGAYLLILVTMVVAYAVSAAKSDPNPAPPKPANVVMYWNA